VTVAATRRRLRTIVSGCSADGVDEAGDDVDEDRTLGAPAGDLLAAEPELRGVTVTADGVVASATGCGPQLLDGGTVSPCGISTSDAPVREVSNVAEKLSESVVTPSACSVAGIFDATLVHVGSSTSTKPIEVCGPGLSTCTVVRAM
jgi:hypothetical protein